MTSWPVGLESLEESQVQVECTDARGPQSYRGVKLSVLVDECTHVLHVSDLMESISSVSFTIKTRSRQILIKMKKTIVKSWAKLKTD